MKEINQEINGSNNQQTVQIFNRPIDIVDICADKIKSILDNISSIDFIAIGDQKLTPPNIPEKNILNNINKANSMQIEKTYARWSEITETISSDASGDLERIYHMSAFILNQSYLSLDNYDFPKFKINAIKIYCQNTNASTDEAFVFTHLLHYMYLNCQLGITP